MDEIDLRRGDFRGRGDRDHVVETHDDVGDGDDAHRAPQRLRALDAAFVTVGVFSDELGRHVEQQRATDQLEEGVSHRLGDDERKDHAQQHRDAGAEDHAPQRWRGGSDRQAMAITTALSPERMMLTPMICAAAIQNGACVMSCHKKSTGYPSVAPRGRRFPPARVLRRGSARL
jgi:hypothetical protein